MCACFESSHHTVSQREVKDVKSLSKALKANLKAGPKIPDSVKLEAKESITIDGRPVRVGMGWTMSKGKADFDLKCLMLNDSGSIVDNVDFNKLESSDGAAVHSGACALVLLRSAQLVLRRACVA